MPESSPKRTQKSTTAKKSSPAKKRTTTRKAKKPKVVLAKNKVALLSGLICGICVLAIGLSVVLTPSEKQNPQRTEIVAKNEARAEQKTSSNIEKNTSKKDAASKKEDVRKSEKQKTKSEPQKTQVEKSDSKKTDVASSAQKKNSIPPVQNQPVKSQKSESVAKNAPVKTQPKPASPERKESSATKTLSSNQTSTERNFTTKNTGAQIASVTPPKQQDTVQQNVPKNRFDIPPAANGATIVIVIDDAGRSAENTKRYASLPFPITIAVLPKLPQTRACAEAVRAAGKELILHQPMQSLNLNLDPGPGKITADMNSYQIASVIKENLLELGPGVKGMNNHEGSLITSNEIKIGAVLEVCAEKGIYFFDSRTTADTKAPQAALERDMKIYEKAGPYLDNDIDRAKMLERIRETLAYANRHGKALVIGHVDKSVKILPDLLAEMYPEMRAAGYRFATPSMLR